jgi:hypothetical protein
MEVRIEQENRPVLCQCPTCHSVFSESREKLEACLRESVELDGGSNHALEELEELRLTLRSFLKPETLQALVDLLEAIDTEPKQTEIYSWFVRNSQFAGGCKYAQIALRKFKEERLDRVVRLVDTVKESLKDV